MWYVYLLESSGKKWHYYGFTSDIEKRFKQHVNGEVESTRYHRPLSLRYFEAFDSEELARRREGQLKSSGSATKAILERINN